MRPGYPDRRVQVSDGVYPYVYIVYITCRAPGSTRPPYTTIYKSQRVFAPTCISVCATCRAPGLAIDLRLSQTIKTPTAVRPGYPDRRVQVSDGVYPYVYVVYTTVSSARNDQTASTTIYKSQRVFAPTCISVYATCRAPGLAIDSRGSRKPSLPRPPCARDIQTGEYEYIYIHVRPCLTLPC